MYLSLIMDNPFILPSGTYILIVQVMYSHLLIIIYIYTLRQFIVGFKFIDLILYVHLRGVYLSTLQV